MLCDSLLRRPRSSFEITVSIHGQACQVTELMWAQVVTGVDHVFNLAADMGGMGFIQSNHSGWRK